MEGVNNVNKEKSQQKGARQKGQDQPAGMDKYVIY